MKRERDINNDYIYSQQDFNNQEIGLESKRSRTSPVAHITHISSSMIPNLHGNEVGTTVLARSDSFWGFDNVQSEHMIQLVQNRFEKKLVLLEKQIMDLKWAKSMRESSQFDTRREYLAQFGDFWLGQELEIGDHLNDLTTEMTFWYDQLTESVDSGANNILNANYHRSIMGNFIERGMFLKNMLDFIKNDAGHLDEALTNMNALSIQQDNDTNMD